MVANGFRCLSVVLILVALCAPSAVAGEHDGQVEVSLNSEGFGEGWRARVGYPTVPNVTDDTHCELWVDEGWLHARRIHSGETAWQVVLAKVQDGVLPKVWHVGKSPSLNVSYAEGRYFIRDNSLVMRTLRQNDSESKPRFTASEVCTDTLKESGNSAGYGRILIGMSVGDWFCAASGPSRDELDCFVRLNRRELYEPNTMFGGMTQGFSMMSDGLLNAFYGAKWTCDDGELLVAYYNVPQLAQKQLNQKKIQDNLVDAAPPEIVASKWLNTKPLNWEQLRGKVVVVDFWATWCSPCVKKIPDMQKLADKFGDDGLVVIGIHSARGGETCEEFTKKMEMTFPVAVDEGTTEEKFGFSGFPSYFLVDKTGNVVDGYMSSPPDEATIRFYLNANVDSLPK